MAAAFLAAAELTRIKTMVFKIPNQFREHQLEAMQSIVLGRNVFFVAATGKGKSLVYQLPSMLRPPFVQKRLPTVVISPLKALIHDQILQLKKLESVQCAALHGGIPFAPIANRYMDLDMLFITPEQLVPQTDEFDLDPPPLLNLLKKNPPQRFVFDEAHCILHWGNSFRPKYLEACQTIAQTFPQVPITLLSATAPPTIRADLQTLFINCKDMDVFVNQQLDRANLEYRLRKKPNTQEALHEEIINQLENVPCAIIYCITKDQVDSLADVLDQHFLPQRGQVQRYHSGMLESRKTLGMKMWQKGLSKVMVATNAFGMGVNAPGVRLIIHTAMPLSLTDYIQQCGRAGRDGKPATCVLYYNVRGDVVQARKMVAEYDPQELDEMISLCVGRTCVKSVLRAKVTGKEEDDVDDVACPGLAKCHCRK